MPPAPRTFCFEASTPHPWSERVFSVGKLINEIARITPERELGPFVVVNVVEVRRVRTPQPLAVFSTVLVVVALAAAAPSALSSRGGGKCV